MFDSLSVNMIFSCVHLNSLREQFSVAARAFKNLSWPFIYVSTNRCQSRANCHNSSDSGPAPEIQPRPLKPDWEVCCTHFCNTTGATQEVRPTVHKHIQWSLNNGVRGCWGWMHDVQYFLRTDDDLHSWIVLAFRDTRDHIVNIHWFYQMQQCNFELRRGPLSADLQHITVNPCAIR